MARDFEAKLDQAKTPDEIKDVLKDAVSKSGARETSLSTRLLETIIKNPELYKQALGAEAINKLPKVLPEKRQDRIKLLDEIGLMSPKELNFVEKAAVRLGFKK